MSVHMVRFRTTPQQAPTVAAEIEAVVAAVREAAPAGARYTALRETDREIFTLLLELPDGAANPLLPIPAAAHFRDLLAGWTQDDPAPRPCTVVGRYEA